MSGTANQSISSFTQLKAWQEAHALSLQIYAITKDFPASEIYGLCSQMQRASVSVTSNIAEGFCRWSAKEQKQFFYISLGSTREIQSQLLLSRDLNYISSLQFSGIAEQTVLVTKLINGLLKTANTRRRE